MYKSFHGDHKIIKQAIISNGQRNFNDKIFRSIHITSHRDNNLTKLNKITSFDNYVETRSVTV